MKKALILLALAAFALPAAAVAGGWATAGLAPPPDGLGAGDTWVAQVTILQHGNPETPLEGVVPTLTVRNGSAARTFTGTPTDEAGVSVIEVVFPSAGRWSYEVYDGFTAYGGAGTHTFQPVAIGPPAGGGGFPALPVAAALLALGAGVLALVRLFRRPRVRAPAPTH